MHRVVRSVVLALLALALLVPAFGGGAEPNLAERYPQAKSFFPEATRFGALEGEPRAAPVFRDDRLIGYLFLTADLVRIRNNFV